MEDVPAEVATPSDAGSGTHAANPRGCVSPLKLQAARGLVSVAASSSEPNDEDETANGLRVRFLGMVSNQSGEWIDEAGCGPHRAA